MIPDKYLHIHEKSHNSYPHFRNLYEQPGMSKDFYLLIESHHALYDTKTGVDDNILKLTEKELKKRQVVYLDIVNGEPKSSKPEWDLHNYVCPEARINDPLVSPKNIINSNEPPEWTRYYKGEMMVCVKCVKFKWRGLQSMVESYAVNSVFPGTFLDSNRALMAWAKDWYPLTIEDIRELEGQVMIEMKEHTF
jgi:hypothetical protein